MKPRVFSGTRGLLIIALLLIVVDCLVCCFWAGLVRARTIHGWCAAVGLSSLAVYAPILWLYVPSYLLVAIAGFFIGVKYRASWFWSAVLLALLWQCGSHLLGGLLWPPSLVPQGSFWTYWVYQCPPIPIAVGCAFLSQKWIPAKHPAGMCSSCEYNLRGNVSGICPECGTSVPEDIQDKLAEEAQEQPG